MCYFVHIEKLLCATSSPLDYRGQKESKPENERKKSIDVVVQGLWGMESNR